MGKFSKAPKAKPLIRSAIILQPIVIKGDVLMPEQIHSLSNPDICGHLRTSDRLESVA